MKLKRLTSIVLLLMLLITSIGTQVYAYIDPNKLPGTLCWRWELEDRNISIGTLVYTRLKADIYRNGTLIDSINDPASYNLPDNYKSNGTPIPSDITGPSKILQAQVGDRVRLADTSEGNLVNRREWDFQVFKPGYGVLNYPDHNYTSNPFTRRTRMNTEEHLEWTANGEYEFVTTGTYHFYLNVANNALWYSPFGNYRAEGLRDGIMRWWYFQQVTVEVTDATFQQVNIIEDHLGNHSTTEITGPIMDEDNVVLTSTPQMELIEWATSDEETATFNNYTTWADVDEIIQLDSGTTTSGALLPPGDIIYVRYRLPEPPPPVVTVGAGDLELTEKRLSRAYNLSQIGPLGSFGFSYPNHGGGTFRCASPCRSSTRTRSDGTTSTRRWCPGHPYTHTIPVTPNYKYVVRYNNTLNPTAIAVTHDRLNPRHVNNTVTGVASAGGGSDRINNANVHFIGWRGRDLPTIASYKESGNANLPILTSLGFRTGIAPQSTRNNLTSYNDPIRFNLRRSNDEGADYSTTFKAIMRDGSTRSGSSTHSTSDTADYSGNLVVRTNLDLANVGNVAVTSQDRGFTAGGVVIPAANATGLAVRRSSQNITFHPYVQMAYDVFNDASGTASQTLAINTLAERVSTFTPTDYIDIGWARGNLSASTPNLNVGSQQWSKHTRAVSNKVWGGRDQVLPGGTIFTLETPPAVTNRTRVVVSSWNTFIPADQLANVTNGNVTYTLANAVAGHNTIRDQIRDSINRLDLVQWVHPNTEATSAFATGGVMIRAEGGQVLTGLTGNETSADPKYHLRRATPVASSRVNEADLDATVGANTSTFYRVRSDINGVVYVESSANNTTWTLLQSINKTQGISALTNAEAIELNSRTHLVTNFINALDRNRGNDPTVSNGPTWYNEAWDGLAVVRTDTVITLGLTAPDTRTAVLDPKLIPPIANRADIYTDAYLSQFRASARSAQHATRC